MNIGRTSASTVLGLDPERLVACVSCGLCLPHCPTYRVTGEESASPRGRISLMRAVDSGSAPIDAEFEQYMDRCVVCRACETACPSGVHFGELMEGTRVALTQRRPTRTPRWLRWSLHGLARHRLLLVGSSFLAIAQRFGVVPESLARNMGLPAGRLPLRRERLRASARRGERADAWLFTGCVMDAWQRPVHAAALRVMAATGARVAVSSQAASGGANCCGALHSHAGQMAAAKRLAEQVIASLPGEAPVVVDSAGCGAALKDYGHLLGTIEAERFSARVRDLGEWLAPRVGQLPNAPGGRRAETVAISDPCHLRHVQRAHLPWRTVLAPFVDVVELDDEGRCCGAGGAYSVLQPELARDIREQKLASIGRSGAASVVSANPGCSIWLERGGASIRHPIEVVDEVLFGRHAGKSTDEQ